MRLAQLQHEGFQVVPELFCKAEIQRLVELLETEAESLQGSARGGTRDVLDRLPSLRELAQNSAILNIVRDALGEGAFVARATLFDKTPEANWKVPWHQDVTIAVREKRELAGYGPWSTKAGVVHVQPPTEVLESMITVRVHLDACAATNGALRVMPGSHRLGRLDQNIVGGFVDEGLAVCCAANAGDALVMRPLLLHASSSSVEARHRRVLHFDYAVGELAGGLQWRMR